MLKSLSGKAHRVKTAVCLWNIKTNKRKVFVETTKVFFHKLTLQEIGLYTDSGEPFDKAGSYGIQGIGAGFIRRIEGDFLNVVGLPIRRVQETMRKNGWNVRPQRKNKSGSRTRRARRN
jgi:septum formation protein